MKSPANTSGTSKLELAIIIRLPMPRLEATVSEITVPTKYTGAVLGDLPTKRAHVENQDSLPGDTTVIYARAPLAEVARYAAQLGGLTQGQGSYAIELSHYDAVPAAVQQHIVSRSKVAADEDEE